MEAAGGHAQTQSPPPPPSETPAVSPSKKRKPEDGDFRGSAYFKIRTIVRDLRPSFIEVLHAPDFRNSKAADDIRARGSFSSPLGLSPNSFFEDAVETEMKTLLELTKELRKELALAGMKKPSEDQSFARPRKEELLDKIPEEEKKGPQPPVENTALKEFAKQLDEGLPGTYVIGGSPIGWNYLVYPGSKLVYYGETKASFLSRQATK